MLLKLTFQQLPGSRCQSKSSIGQGVYLGGIKVDAKALSIIGLTRQAPTCDEEKRS